MFLPPMTGLGGDPSNCGSSTSTGVGGCNDIWNERGVILHIAVEEPIVHGAGSGLCAIVSVQLEVVSDRITQPSSAQADEMPGTFTSMSQEAEVARASLVQSHSISTSHHLIIDLEACSARSLWLLRNITGVQCKGHIASTILGWSRPGPTMYNTSVEAIPAKFTLCSIGLYDQRPCSHSPLGSTWKFCDAQQQAGLPDLSQRLETRCAYSCVMGCDNGFQRGSDTDAAAGYSCSGLPHNSLFHKQAHACHVGSHSLPGMSKFQPSDPQELIAWCSSKIGVYDKLKRARGRARAFSVKHAMPATNEMNLSSDTSTSAAAMQHHHQPTKKSTTMQCWVAAEKGITCMRSKHKEVRNHTNNTN